MRTLWDVMNHCNDGDKATAPWLDKKTDAAIGADGFQIDDMVAFLASLTSPQYKAARLPRREADHQKTLSR